MKKFLALLLAALLLTSLAACAKEPAGGPDDPGKQDTSGSKEDASTPSKTDDSGKTDEPGKTDNSGAAETPALSLASSPLSDIREAVMANVPDQDPTLGDRMLDKETYDIFLQNSSMKPEDYPFDEWYAYDTFVEYVEGYETLVHEPMLSSIPFCVVLLRTPAGTDVKDLAKRIKENANPYKFGCEEAEIIETYVNGSVVLFVMLGGAEDELADQKLEVMRDNFLALT